MSGGTRITGGTLRGRSVRVPASARPTSSRLREAVFSHWQDRIDGAAFLDLFAGSGAVGFEAVSRGAAEVVWVESDRRAAETLEQGRVGLGAAGVLRRGDALRVARDLARAGRRFDLVYADPPYSWTEHLALLAAVGPLLASDGELALEHADRSDPPAAGGGLVRLETRRYGDSAVSFYRPLAEEEIEPG